MIEKINKMSDTKHIQWSESQKENIGIKYDKVVSDEFKGQCLVCHNKIVIPTKKTVKGNRTYECARCHAIMGSPTNWARCELFGLIGKDDFFNDCELCEIPKKERFNIQELVKQKKHCPYFKGKVYFDEYNDMNPNKYKILKEE